MERDPELEVVICEVLSLENDYPRVYPTKRARETPQQQTEPPAARRGASHEEDGSTPKRAGPAVPSQEPSSPSGGALKRTRPAVPSEEPSRPSSGAIKKARPTLLSEGPSVSPGGSLKMSRPSLPSPEPSVPSPGGDSRRRTSFRPDQLALLRAAFHLNPYPDFSSRSHISEVTGVPESRVQVWFQNRRARHLPKPAEPSVGQQHRRQHWQLDQNQHQEQYRDQNLYQHQNQHQDQNLYQHQEQNQYQDQTPHYPATVRRIQTPDIRTPGSPLTLRTGPSPVPQQASCPQGPGHPGPGDAPAPLLWNLQEDYLCDLDFLEGWPIASPWSPVFTFGSSHHALGLSDQLSSGP